MTAAPRKALAQSPAPHPTPLTQDPWADVHAQARSLTAALQTLAPSQHPETQVACAAYCRILDEIARLASAHGDVPSYSRLDSALTLKQLQDFGRLLRDKRNRAGFSRVQLATKAKISDATIKFTETARHPPSRATLLRLVGVAELGLRWAETPGYSPGAAIPELAPQTEQALVEAEFSRFDSRLTVPMMLELILVVDELRASQHAVEVTVYGSRRSCCLCGARSDAWTVDAAQAAKLPLRHVPLCVGRLADSLWQRFPVLAELARKERRSLCNPTAAALDVSLGEVQRERFYGCRSGAQLAAQLARLTSLPPTPYRAGVGAMLLWALALSPCPVEPTDKPFSEPRAQQLAQLLSKRALPSLGDASRLRGVSETAAWIVEPQAPEPHEPLSLSQDASAGGDSAHVPTSPR